METGKWGSGHRLPSSSLRILSRRACVTRPLLCPQHTGRTEAWKVLSPQGSPWDSVARVLPNGSLLLPAVGIPDEGTFRCRAMSRKGKEIKSNYQVRVYRKGFRASPQKPTPRLRKSLHPQPSTPLLALVVGESSKPQLLMGVFPPQRSLGSQKLSIPPRNSRLVSPIR